MLVEHRWGQFQLHVPQIPSLSELQNNLFPPVGTNIYTYAHKTEANTKLLQVMDTTLKWHIDNRNYHLLESGDVPLRIHIQPPAFPQT